MPLCRALTPIPGLVTAAGLGQDAARDAREWEKHFHIQLRTHGATCTHFECGKVPWVRGSERSLTPQTALVLR